MSQIFEHNAFGFASFIKERAPHLKIILLPNDDGDIVLTKQEVDGGRYYPMLLHLHEDAIQPSRIRLVIAIGDDTVKQLRKREVMQWVEDCQRWLEQFHITEFPLSGRPALLASLSALNQGGSSAAEIANFLNEWIVRLLANQIQIEEVIKTAPVINEETWQGLRDLGFNVNAKIQALHILTWMGIEPDPALEYIVDGIETLRSSGSPVFLPGQPIDRNRVLNRIREWQATLA